MLSSHTLAHVANARMLLFHPGVDHSLQSRHSIPTLSAIKSFKPVHCDTTFNPKWAALLIIKQDATGSPLHVSPWERVYTSKSSQSISDTLGAHGQFC